MFEIEILNQQASMPIKTQQLEDAVRMVLAGEGLTAAEISIAVVDDPTIHNLNRSYLEHDYATDVLSFLLEREEDFLEGEIIVSADTAMAAAAQFGWSADEELLLYLVHGALHLTGYDDLSEADRHRMLAREQHYLNQLGMRTDKARRYHRPAMRPSDNAAAEGDLPQ